jgi:adenine-specific DNA methylase
MLTGTWPMRSERPGRMLDTGSNAFASSIVLVCRPRLEPAKTTSRRAFLRELNQVLPEALDEMTRGAGDERSPVAPVDLSQAIIGPGMAVFSKYAAVLEADGTPMSARTALQPINRFPPRTISTTTLGSGRRSNAGGSRRSHGCAPGPCGRARWHRAFSRAALAARQADDSNPVG